MTSLHRKTKCYSRWEGSHCEEDVNVVGVKDLLNPFAHFFNLKQTTMKTTSASYIHVLTQRKCLDEEHGVAELIWILRVEREIRIHKENAYWAVLLLPANVYDLLVHWRNESALRHDLDLERC